LKNLDFCLFKIKNFSQFGCILFVLSYYETVMTDASKAQLFFDKEYKIRVLDPTKYEKSELLEKECGNFVEKINGFNERIVSLAEILDAHAQRIDAQKLRV
jgi:hypothetical protein